jgi:hypothetical protein
VDAGKVDAGIVDVGDHKLAEKRLSILVAEDVGASTTNAWTQLSMSMSISLFWTQSRPIPMCDHH